MINKWEALTNKISHAWIRDYFDIEDDEEISVDWVADDVGTVFEFCGYFIGFDDILACYKHNISVKKYHEWYDYCLENHKINISLAKFILSPEEKLEKEQKELADCKKRLEYAKEEFNKAMKKYENKN